MQNRIFKHARILIIDDEPANVELLQRLLERAGFANLEATTEPRQAAELYVQHRPDLILLDLHMPGMDGLAVMDQLNEIAEASYLPILMLTGDMTPTARQEALSRGAKDFVSKPFHADEVLLRIRTLLETRFLYFQVQSQNQILEAKVRERTRELEAAQIEIIERLARAAEFRDDNTGQHTERVGQMAALLARQLGLPDPQVSLIRRAAPLHDVGKIGIPDAVLLKLGKLTLDEFELVKTHTTIGARILSGSRFGVLRLAEEIAFSHHERWDGDGYVGIRQDQIPLAGRIVAVADVFDALTQKRPYKAAWPIVEAIAEIERQRTRQFDPEIVDAFLRVIEQQSPARPRLISPSMHIRSADLVAWLRTRVTATGADGLIVPLTDSLQAAVVARLCQLAVRDAVLGALLPAGADERARARTLAQQLQLPVVDVDCQSAAALADELGRAGRALIRRRREPSPDAAAARGDAVDARAHGRGALRRRFAQLPDRRHPGSHRPDARRVHEVRRKATSTCCRSATRSGATSSRWRGTWNCRPGVAERVPVAHDARRQRPRIWSAIRPTVRTALRRRSR